MKKILISTILSGLLLLAPRVYSQEVNNWELKVYYDATDRVWQLPKGRSKEQYNQVLRDVANENGLTFAEMKDIVDRIWDAGYLSDREIKILDRLDEKYKTLPKGASKDEQDRIYREVANEYGISVNVLYDMDERSWWWF